MDGVYCVVNGGRIVISNVFNIRGIDIRSPRRQLVRANWLPGYNVRWLLRQVPD